MVIMHELAPALRPFVFFPGESILLALLLLCPAKTGEVYIYIRVSRQWLQRVVRTTAPEHREWKMTELLSWRMSGKDKKNACGLRLKD